MKLLEEIGIRFLIGIFIAALIGFFFWWFMIYNESDRITQRSFEKFLDALDNACKIRATESNPVIVYVEIPQKRFQNPFEEGINWIKEKLGMQVPFTAFNDPYYNFHWEKFPPEAPYELGDILKGSSVGTLMAFFFPWSEDLPWSTNLMTTMMFMTFALGIDVLDVKEVQQAIGRASKYVKNIGREALEELGDKFPRIAKALDGIEEFVDKIKDYTITIKGKTMKVLEIATTEVKFASKISALYTLICLVTQDKTLGECLIEGAVVGVLSDASKFVSQHYIIPNIKDKLSIFFHKIKNDVSAAFSEFILHIEKRIEYLEQIFLGVDEKIFENIDEYNKVLNEIKSYIDEAKKLASENNRGGALYYLKEAGKKLENVEKILEETPIKEEYRSFFFFARVDVDLLSSEIDDMIKYVSEIEDIPIPNPYIELDSVLYAIDKTVDDTYEKPIKKVLEKNGFEIDEKGKLVLTEENNKELFENFRDATEIAKQQGKVIDSYNGFKFEYDENGNLIKVIYDPVDPNSFTSKIKNYVFGYPKKFLAMLESKGFIHNKLIDGEVVRTALEEIKETILQNENLKKRLLEGFKEIGKEMSEKELLNYIDETIKKYEVGENLALVVEKNSKLAELIDSVNNPKEISSKIREMIFEAAQKGDKTELINFYGLITGKTLRIREDLSIFFRRGVIGYAALRAIDLYTPLGASWWDKYISYYGYEGQKVDANCRTKCSEGKICLQLGACIQNRDLPKSCRELGIKSVKLKRSSVVAPDPRFYLVSPCYANLKIFIDQNDGTIFIKPEIDKSKLKERPNYCYATEGLINYYMSMYTAQYVIRCAAAIACGVGHSILTGGLTAVKAILEIAAVCLMGVASGECGVIADLIDMLFSIYRESMLVWPTVYQSHSFLAS